MKKSFVSFLILAQLFATGCSMEASITSLIPIDDSVTPDPGTTTTTSAGAELISGGGGAYESTSGVEAGQPYSFRGSIGHVTSEQVLKSTTPGRGYTVLTSVQGATTPLTGN